MFFSYGINTLGAFLLVFALYNYLKIGESEVFFYHNFVEILNGSAIYHSLLFTISLLFLFEHNKLLPSKKKLILIVFNTIILFLLSSKTFVFAAGLIYLFYFFSMKRGKFILVIAALLFLGSQFFSNGQNISDRYSELDLSTLFSSQSREITPATYFDGVSLRLELWEIGLELSTENYKTFLFGVGPGDAQYLLNQKIIDRNMYTGVPQTEDEGYLNYNFHNQYIQNFGRGWYNWIGPFLS